MIPPNSTPKISHVSAYKSGSRKPPKFEKHKIPNHAQTEAKI